MRPAAKGQWSTGLCECCTLPGGCSTCCYAYCCPCCQYGQNVEKMAPGEVCCGGNCCGACCCYFLMMDLGLCCFLHCGARGWIRKKYGLPGDPCQDCCTVLCCPPCAMCQEYRELTIRQEQKGGQEAAPSNKVAPSSAVPPQQQAYAPPPQAYPPQQQAYVPPPQAYPPQQQAYVPPPQAYPPPQQAYAPPPQAYPPPQQAYVPPPQAFAAPPPQAYQAAYTEPMYVQAPQGYGGKHKKKRSSGSSSDEE